MPEIKLSVELVQAIANYLATKPYAEVFQLINAIGKAAQVKPEEKKEEKEKPTE